MLILINSSFLDFKLSILRNKKTSNSLFRQTMNEISYLIAAEVLKYLKFKQISVQTPIKKTSRKKSIPIYCHSTYIKSWIRPSRRFC